MLRNLSLAVVALIPVACGTLRGQEDSTTEPTAKLSTEETRLAIRLAEQTVSRSRGERVYFIKTDLLPASDADAAQRQVNVIHYRYQGDETIITTVDLQALAVLKTERLRHFPTALAADEKQRAESLARHDPRCRTQFATPSIHVEFRPFQATDSSDPAHGHRLVHVMLRDGADYLSRPRIVVDLTRDIVHVD